MVHGQSPCKACQFSLIKHGAGIKLVQRYVAYEDKEMSKSEMLIQQADLLGQVDRATGSNSCFYIASEKKKGGTTHSVLSRPIVNLSWIQQIRVWCGKAWKNVRVQV
jgi:hypothetical protein